MSKHTPTPWSIHGDNRTLIGCDDQKMMLAEVLYEHVVTEWGRSLEVCQANAELIVRAVNSHKALVMALEAFLAMPYPSVGQDMSYQTAQDIQRHRNVAREALELAKFGRTDGR